MKITLQGIDIAKTVFVLVGLDEGGQVRRNFSGHSFVLIFLKRRWIQSDRTDR